MSRTQLTAALFAGLIASIFSAAHSSAQNIDVVRIASGLNRPVAVTAAPGDNNRMFIVEQHTGQIKIWNRTTGTVNGTPFLDLNGLTTGGEQGLLGLAFHPDYQSNGQFYVNYTNGAGSTVVQRFNVSGDPEIANAGSAQTVLTIPQFAANHNGGWIEFNPIANAANDNTNYLYIGVGDGGGGNDPGEHGQNPNTLLGTILRIDVDRDDFADTNINYAIPDSNPFTGGGGAGEVWAYGLRNPYRNGFDRLTGDLYIGDVGQNALEEINQQPASSMGGENYGWRLREGTIPTPTPLGNPVGGPKPTGAIDPIDEYPHEFDSTGGFAVIGGYVYRGPNAALQGQYFYGDNVTNNVWSIEFDGDDPADHDGTNFTNFRNWNDGGGAEEFIPDVGTIGGISSFGEDNFGNLYIVDLGGEVFMVVPEPSTYWMALIGCLAIGLIAWRVRRLPR